MSILVKVGRRVKVRVILTHINSLPHQISLKKKCYIIGPKVQSKTNLDWSCKVIVGLAMLLD